MKETPPMRCTREGRQKQNQSHSWQWNVNGMWEPQEGLPLSDTFHASIFHISCCGPLSLSRNELLLLRPMQDWGDALGGKKYFSHIFLHLVWRKPSMICPWALQWQWQRSCSWAPSSTDFHVSEQRSHLMYRACYPLSEIPDLLSSDNFHRFPQRGRLFLFVSSALEQSLIDILQERRGLWHRVPLICIQPAPIKCSQLKAHLGLAESVRYVPFI